MILNKTCSIFFAPITRQIDQTMDKIGRTRSGSPICLITSMITERIGRHTVLLAINHIYNKSRDSNSDKTFYLSKTAHRDPLGTHSSSTVL